MRTSAIIKIEGQYEIWGIFHNGILIHTVKRVINNW
jgi:hypothetical protein